MIKLLVGSSVLALISFVWAAYLLVSIGEYKEQCNTRLAEVAEQAQQERADVLERERRKAAEAQNRLQTALDEERQRRIDREREAIEYERELLAKIEDFQTQEAVAWQQVKLPDEVLYMD